jgi:hypothetical protein
MLQLREADENSCYWPLLLGALQQSHNGGLFRTARTLINPTCLPNTIGAAAKRVTLHVTDIHEINSAKYRQEDMKREGTGNDRETHPATHSARGVFVGVWGGGRGGHEQETCPVTHLARGVVCLCVCVGGGGS